MPATVNTEINGWCDHCKEWSLRVRDNQCVWCDEPLTDGPAPEAPRPGFLPPLTREEAVELVRGVYGPRVGSRGKPIGKHHSAITEELVREAYALYRNGTDEQGKPMSGRKVAAAIFPRTKYANERACASSLFEAWKARGWPLRDRVAAVQAVTTTHGLLVGIKGDWTSPAARAARQAYRRSRRSYVKCTEVKQTHPHKGRPCPQWAMDGTDKCYQHNPAVKAEREAHLAAMRASVPEAERLANLERARAAQAKNHHNGGGPDGPRNHRQGHDDERPPEALAWPGGRARNEAA